MKKLLMIIAVIGFVFNASARVDSCYCKPLSYKVGDVMDYGSYDGTPITVKVIAINAGKKCPNISTCNTCKCSWKPVLKIVPAPSWGLTHLYPEVESNCIKNTGTGGGN